MMKKQRQFPRFVFVALLLGLYCGSALTGCEHAGATTTRITQSQGFYQRTIVDENGLPHSYVVYVPHGYLPNAKCPVLMFLNGAGENGDDGLFQLSNNFGVAIHENRKSFPFLTIAPQCRKTGNWNSRKPRYEMGIQILDQVIHEFRADEDRIFLTGVSSGGDGVWNIATAFPERFAAIVPLCSASGNAHSIATARLPIWSLYNDGDEPTLMNASRQLRQRLIEQGSSPLVTNYDASGHDCWNRGYRTTAVYEWLLKQSRSQNKKSRLFQYLPAERLLKEWHASTAGTWIADENGVLVGSRKGTDGRNDLISDLESDSIELHGDAFLQPGIDCRIGLVSESQSWWISIVLPEAGTGGAVNSQAEWHGQLDPAAQHTLKGNSWNDVRIRLSGNRIAVHLNGWSAMDFEVPSTNASQVPSKYRLAIAAPDDGAEIRWRYLRIRTDDQ